MRPKSRCLLMSQHSATSHRAPLILAVLTVSLASCRSRSDVSAEDADSPHPRCARLVDSAILASRSKLQHAVAEAASERSARESPRRYLFEFEVTTGAASTSVQRASASGTEPIVQFVVDSAGVVDTTTVQIVTSRGGEPSQGVAVAAVRDWRFSPAQIAGCAVAQLVQVPLP
jgi:TonB family protein